MSKILLGISESHNATAALFIDGRLVSCIQEERLTRKKNIGGFPIESVNYLLTTYNITPEDVSGLCIANESPTNHFTWRENGNRHFYTKGIRGVDRVIAGLPMVGNPSLRVIRNIMDEMAVRFVFPTMQKKQISEIQDSTGIAADKIRFVNHHTTHAWANVYFLPPDKRDLTYLVITSDGLGDRLSATINTYQDSKMERVESISYHDSIALFYQHVTGFMGMKECEHEYKVMGLAPYADQNLAFKALDKIRHLFRIENTDLHCKVYVANYYHFLGKTLANVRFDAVAAAAQNLVEEITLNWIRNIVKTYSVPNLVLGGGLFMNVKINKLLREIPEIEEIYICPSCGDESCAIGAAFYVHNNEVSMKVIGNPSFSEQPSIYLGPEYSDIEYKEAIKMACSLSRLNITTPVNIEEKVAELLSLGQIVARFKGRMEFGARALGNRSILANPSDPDVVRTINTMIKNRDFWMPFALTILDSKKDEYLIAKNNTISPFMMMTYDSTSLAQKQLSAGLHPYDMTTRPQILTEEANPSYFRLIKKFEDLTGIGAVLNTSFNLHGEPIVCSPQDAMKTFQNSELKYLAMGNFLISKE